MTILTGGLFKNFFASGTSALFPLHDNYFATSHLCLTVPPPLAALGATALVGDLPAAPTEVELGAGGWKSKTITILNMDMRAEIWWECLYNQQFCWKYSYHFVNLGFKLHYTGLKLVQPDKCSTSFVVFHYNASQLKPQTIRLTHKLLLPPPRTRCNRTRHTETGILVRHRTDDQHTKKYQPWRNLSTPPRYAEISGLLGSAAVLFDK